jgi:two-component system response regulator GlrR
MSISDSLDDKELDYRYAKDKFERDYIIQLLKKTQGNISEAAKLAGFSRRSLYEKINLFDINLSEYKR